MLVQELMTRDPVTTTPETPLPDALNLMRERKVRRLPVIGKSGKLVGIVAEKDLLYASPSPATSLSVFEINSLIAKITIASLMTRTVVTVTEDTPVEEAARIMTDQKIGGLPVMDGDNLVGIVTETDLFRALLQLLGGRRPGLRVKVQVSGAKGTFAEVAGVIAKTGGNIVGLGVNEVSDAADSPWNMTFKVQDVSKGELISALGKAGIRLLDAREVKA